jgi:hypothetical protein
MTACKNLTEFLKRKWEEKALQKVFWRTAFNCAPSLHGVGEFYPSVPVSEDQDATVSVVLSSSWSSRQRVKWREKVESNQSLGNESKFAVMHRF